MNEAPKSIWRKTFKGRMAWITWLALLAFTVIFGWFIVDIYFGTDSIVRRPIIAVGVLFTGLVLFYAVSFLHWLYKRHWRKTVFTLVCLVTVVALFYAEENWRGRHDLNQFRREWEAKGEKFDFKDFIPSPVPDDQNFALTPIVASSYGNYYDKQGHLFSPPKTNVVDRMRFDWLDHKNWLDHNNLKINVFGRWNQAKLSDLKPLQENYRDLAAKTNLFTLPPLPQTPAADVLHVLSRYDATVEELRQAGQLPYSRFPLDYDADTFALPHVSALINANELLNLRAIAELQNGQNDLALADVLLSLRLLKSIQSEPFIILLSIRNGMMESIFQPIYEGLAGRHWTDAQLAKLDAELAKLDFLADYQFAIRSQRALSNRWMELLKQGNYRQVTDLFHNNNGRGEDCSTLWEQIKLRAEEIGFKLMPRGWIDQNQLFLNQWGQTLITNTSMLEKPQAASLKAHLLEQEFNRFRFHTKVWPWNFLALTWIPYMPSSSLRPTHLQSSVDMARVAIALERYRLAHGEFPETLDALAPQFMPEVPHDLVGGQPLHYHRTPDGQFILYSIGWNAVDDGGVITFYKGRDIIDYQYGDWVWRYLAK